MTSYFLLFWAIKINLKSKNAHKIKCMTKMENSAGSRKVAHILKVWSLLSTKIPISSKSVGNSSVMSHSPAAPPVFTNSADDFFSIY